MFFSFFLLRLAIRNTWAAAAVYVALFGSLSLSSGGLSASVLVVTVTATGLWVMIRFGILPHAVMILVSIVVSSRARRR